MLNGTNSIAFVIATLEGGGAARVMLNMASYWARAGHRVTIYSFEDGSSPSFYPVHEDVEIVYLNLLKQSESLLDSLKNNWDRIMLIRREVLSCSPDVVISFIDTANVRLLLSMLGAGVKVIVSERIDPSYEDIGRLWSTLRMVAYPLASSVVVQTRAAKNYFSGWPLRSLEVIPNMVRPPVSFAPNRRGEQKRVVAVGRLYEQKGYGLLLNSFARVAEEFPDWTLSIAGHGPQKEVLEKMVSTFGLTDRVLLLGHVKDIGGLLESADVYVLSSDYEGFPNSLCEAMASGLASVSTDCPSGPADIIRDGINGLLVPCGDTEALSEALKSLMGDADLRSRLGNEARTLKDTYSEEKVMGMWESCINKALGES